MCGRRFLVKGGGSLPSKEEGHETGWMETALHPLRRQPNKDFSDLILSILTSVIKITSHVDKRPHSFARFSWIGDVFQEFLPSVLSIMKCLKFEKIVEASHRAGGLPPSI